MQFAIQRSAQSETGARSRFPSRITALPLKETGLTGKRLFSAEERTRNLLVEAVGSAAENRGGARAHHDLHVAHR